MNVSAGQVVLRSAQAFWRELPVGVRLSGKVIVYAPILAKSTAIGLSFPDLDFVVPGIGIGGHRWAVTHSAVAAWLAKQGLATIDQYVSNEIARTAMRQATAAAGAGFAIGIAIHLLKDAFVDGDQTVRFRVPFIGGPGTLLQGTYLDDDIWLGGNGLYALKLAGDMLVMGFGEDALEAKAAFQRWQQDRAVVREINVSREATMAESRQLSHELHLQIPVDTSEDVDFPQWLRAEGSAQGEAK